MGMNIFEYYQSTNCILHANLHSNNKQQGLRYDWINEILQWHRQSYHKCIPNKEQSIPSVARDVTPYLIANIIFSVWLKHNFCQWSNEFNVEQWLTELKRYSFCVLKIVFILPDNNHSWNSPLAMNVASEAMRREYLDRTGLYTPLFNIPWTVEFRMSC